MDGEGSDVSVAFRIEHHTEHGTSVVRHLVELDRRAISRLISRVFEEVLAGVPVESRVSWSWSRRAPAGWSN
ncbi:MAG: hypothetical protein M3Q71_21780, partial [Chloroflexota bacterium]|nr:hypothetical protein [Chloroflexota bacterium]